MENPFEAYRRAHRALRREFDAFTRANCATCPTPCCRKPARVGPADVLIAQASGWKAQLDSDADPVVAAADQALDALLGDDAEAPPCDFLGAKGCTFPDDLRPYGCTAWVCRYMYEQLDRRAVTRVRRLLRDLERAHDTLMRSIFNGRTFDE